MAGNAATASLRRAAAPPRENYAVHLRVEPDRIDQIRRLELWRTHTHGPSRTRRLEVEYFDTPHLSLRAMGAALRVRRAGTQRIRAIELPAGEQANPFASREIESATHESRPNWLRLAGDAVDAYLKDAGICGGMVPIFNIELTRRVWRVDLHGSEIEVALEIGELIAGKRRLAINELALSLKAGRPGHLLELAMMLHREVPVALEHETRAARGYRLSVGGSPSAEKARLAPVTLDMSGRRAFVAIAQCCLQQILANEACTRLAKNPEGVHQFRVGLRRLRALVKAFQREIAAEFYEFLAEDLGWLQEQCGGARDWDVFISDSLERLKARLPGDNAVPKMLRAAGQLRDESHGALLAALDEPRYCALILRLQLALSDESWCAAPEAGGAMLDRPAPVFAATVLNRRYKKLRAIGGKQADLSEDEMHRLRIACKKLRYLAEFFRGLYPRKSTERFIEALVSIQDKLGSLNDAVVGHRLLPALEKFMADIDGAHTVSHANGLVTGWQAARIDRDLMEFRAVWDELLGLPPFWPRRP